MPIATVNGVNLSYQVDGVGPPLVLMHGFSTGSFVWDPVVDRLARNFQVFRYDHRGHGNSTGGRLWVDRIRGPGKVLFRAQSLRGAQILGKAGDHLGAGVYQQRTPL